ncbi:MAG: TrmH family RNA methyltransferase, partial [Leptospirales bacterium]
MRTPGGRSDRSNQQKKRTDSNRARPGGRAQSPDGAPQQARPAGRPERGIRKKSEREAGKHRPKPRNRPAGDANRDADARGLLFGRRPVQAYTDVLAEPSPDAAKHSDVEAIYLSESFPKKLRDALLRKLPTVPFQELPRRELDQMYPDIHHQGVILRFRAGTRPGNQADELDWRTFVQERSGLLLLLDRIQDPQNLGSILRSAEALGVRAVFMTGQGAPLGDTAHRVSSGASLRLP